LTVGMNLEGVVTNVANFGAFVDVGVHQDGLIHVSQLADRFVSDPTQIVKVGQVVKVRVMEVNEKLKRISLSMRIDIGTDTRPDGGSSPSSQPAVRSPQSASGRSPQTPAQKRPPERSSAENQDQPKASTLDDLKAKFGKKK